MENKIVLSKEELDQIKSIQDLYAKVIVELGQIDIQLNNLDNLVKELEVKKSDTLEVYSSMQKREKELGKELSKKYGDGTIDTANGEFIPAPK